MDRSRVAIVIPALNESATIARIVEEAGKYGVPIVVDDGSTDTTAKLAKLAGAVVVSHESNLGYDKALDTGFVRAEELNCTIVITLDADGQHTPSLLDNFTTLLDEGADVVIGIRDKRQRLAEHIFAFLTWHLYGIADPLCGMKAYRLSVYKALGHFDSYGSVGTELALFAAKNNFRIKQIAVPVMERNDAPRFGRKFSANYKIFRALVMSFVKIQSKADER
jgi:glycosyltransferase involved in cell wall biosynthesis